MKNEFTNFWQEFLRWLITTLVFGIYIALTFVYFTGDWKFLTDFEYWTVTLSSTSIAWFLRFLWTDKGLATELFRNQEIHEKEQGKDLVIEQITKNNLTDVLEGQIDVINKKEKTKQYKNKCERKMRQHRNSRMFKKYHSKRADYWKNERVRCDQDDFNVDTVRVAYYKYDIDSMLSSKYRPSHEVETRGDIKREVAKSYRITVVTMIVFMVLGALQIFAKEYNAEDLVVLFGRLLVFLMNIYNGFGLGVNFVRSKYSNDITKDYVFMKRVLKENGF